MNGVTRWRGPTLSLPVERDSILDQPVSTNQYISTNGVIAIEGVTVLLQHYNCFLIFFVEKNYRNRTCHLSLPECAIHAVSCEGATTLLSLCGRVAPPALVQQRPLLFVWNQHHLTVVEGHWFRHSSGCGVLSLVFWSVL